MADRVPRKLRYMDGPVPKTWPDREDLSEAEIRARAAGWPEEPEILETPEEPEGDEEA